MTSAATASTYIPATPATPALVAPVAVVGPQFCMPHPIDLALNTKQMSMTGSVMDINGNVVFRVRGKLFSLHDKKTLIDSSGNTLLSMQQKLFSGHSRWQVFRGESFDPKDLLFTVKKSAVFQWKTELDVCVAANTAENAPDFTIKGSTVYLGETNTVLARMTKEETLETIVLGNDIFGVAIYPNVDYAFIVALIVILDEINKTDQVMKKLYVAFAWEASSQNLGS